jgi:diacylglycerol kinase (ATP)
VSICIIFNPAARGEKAVKFRKHLEEMRGDWVLKPTPEAGAARRLAAEAVREGYETIIAAGGDGTLNEALNGVADVPGGLAKTRLGVLPLGTVNVFARELRLPLDVRKVWPVLEKGRETTIDLGCAEFQNDGAKERRYFLQLAGAGFDAHAVELVDWQLKKKAGPAAYLVAGLRALSSERVPITISNGSESHTGELVLIGNGKFYGGSFPVFHKSDLQDGVLDAVVLKKINWQALPGHVWDFVCGRFFKEGTSMYLRGKEFNLTSPRHAALQLEGELVGELPAKISVLPRALRVVIP